MKSLEQKVKTWAVEHSFSGVVSVSKQNSIIYQKAYGYADRANKRLNTIDTRFATASGTKFFTALAIGKLIDQKKISFDTPVAEIITSLPELSKQVTIRHLLNHTSGVYDYLDEELIEDFDTFELPIAPYKLNSCSDYLPMMKGPAKFDAGERFAYSNGGYILLGIVIETITKETFQEYVQRELFDELNMNRSGFFALNALPENSAFNYLDEESGNETNLYKLPIVGGSDGGAFVTANDIALLWDAFVSNQILSEQLTKEFLSARITVEDNSYYGFGYWVWQEKDQEPILYLDGFDAGVSFQSKRLPDGTVITVISNTGKEIWPLAVAIEELL